MTGKTFTRTVLLLGLAALAAAAWWQRDSSVARQLRDMATRATTLLDWRTPRAPNPKAQANQKAGSAQPEGGLRKCIGQSGALYTDGNCPPGSTEQAVVEGAVTVLPGRSFGAGATPSGTAASTTSLRDLALGPDGKTLKEKALERAD